jgi:hypothetical protein
MVDRVAPHRPGHADPLRALASGSVLAAGLAHGEWSGVVVGSTALSVGVLAEALFVALLVKRIAPALPEGDATRPPLRGRLFASFYVPLALTPVVILVIRPVGTAAISRMPDVVESLAAWPVLAGMAFVLQSLGIAYHEVVVALLQRPGSRAALRRFAIVLAVAGTGVWALLTFTPLSELWFVGALGLPPELAATVIAGMAIALPIPATRVLQSWQSGVLIAARRTRAITEAVIVFAVVCTATLAIGVAWQGPSGFYVMVTGFTLGPIAQSLWLYWRARGLD